MKQLQFNLTHLFFFNSAKGDLCYTGCVCFIVVCTLCVRACVRVYVYVPSWFVDCACVRARVCMYVCEKCYLCNIMNKRIGKLTRLNKKPQLINKHD